MAKEPPTNEWNRETTKCACVCVMMIAEREKVSGFGANETRDREGCSSVDKRRTIQTTEKEKAAAPSHSATKEVLFFGSFASYSRPSPTTSRIVFHALQQNLLRDSNNK